MHKGDRKSNSFHFIYKLCLSGNPLNLNPGHAPVAGHDAITSSNSHHIISHKYHKHAQFSPLEPDKVGSFCQGVELRSIKNSSMSQQDTWVPQSDYSDRSRSNQLTQHAWIALSQRHRRWLNAKHACCSSQNEARNRTAKPGMSDPRKVFRLLPITQIIGMQTFTPIFQLCVFIIVTVP